MKIGLFDPYLDTLGGGERYMMTIAEYLSQQGYQVDVFWHDKKLKKKIETRLNIDLSGVNFCSPVKNVLKKFKIYRNYNLFVHVSDGSIPFLFAKKNILHFQVPFHGVGGQSWLNQIKLRLIDKIVCNSHFTKKYIDQEYGVNSIVIYPPVDVESFKPLKKENLILSVGRFDSPLHPKNQDLMIEVFKKMCRQGLSGWQLVLIGGSSINRSGYLERLRRSTADYPIKILTNISFEKLREYYGKAKIYWHAAGFGSEEKKKPERAEHFGISTVEAMAAGCVPVVCSKGGQREIIDQAIDGFLWRKKDELIKYTRELIDNENWRKKLAQRARKKSQRFSKKIFCKKFQELIE